MSISPVNLNFPTYLALGAQPGQLISKPAQQARIVNSPLQFDFNSPTMLQNAAIPSVLPDIPEQYARQVQSLYLSDQNLQSLLNTPSFIIPGNNSPSNGLMGIQYNTDGHGGITSSQLVSVNRRIDANPNQVPDLSSIAQGAVFQVNPGTGSSASSISPPILPGDIVKISVPAEENIAPLESGLFKIQNATSLAQVIPDRFASPFPPSIPPLSIQRQLAAPSVSLFGSVTGVSPEQVRQVATNRADFGLRISPDAASQIQGLVQKNLALGTIGAANNPDRQLASNLAEGRLPLSFPLPSGISNAARGNPLIDLAMDLDQNPILRSAGGSVANLSLRPGSAGVLLQTPGQPSGQTMSMQTSGQPLMQFSFSGGMSDGQGNPNSRRRPNSPQITASI